MKVASLDGKTFTLTGETEADQALLDAIDMVRHVAVRSMVRTRPEGFPFTINAGCELVVSHDCSEMLVAQAAHQALRCLGDLFRIGLREAAQHGHVGADAADPQAQVALASCLVQLQNVLQTLGVVVREREPVIEEVVSAHGGPSDAAGGSTVNATAAATGGATGSAS